MSLTTDARIRREYFLPEASLHDKIMNIVNIAEAIDNGVKTNRIRRRIARAIGEGGLIRAIPEERATLALTVVLSPPCRTVTFKTVQN